MTEPPPRANFSANATQWTIYDAYQEDFEENVSKYFKKIKIKLLFKNEAKEKRTKIDEKNYYSRK